MSSRRISPNTGSLPTKVLGDAIATKLTSHHPWQPDTGAGAVPRAVHPGTTPHSPGSLANRAEAPSRHSMTGAQCGVVLIRLWATPCWRVLGTIHKVGLRHTDAPTPALSCLTRDTLGGAPITIGHSCPHSTVTAGPAAQHWRPLGGGKMHLTMHEQWQYGAGCASPSLMWTPRREMAVCPTSLRGA